MQRLSECAKLLGLPLPAADAVLSGACIDTRKLKAGELFVALPGEHCDGHDFVAQAAALGAGAALVARRVDCELPQLVVDDVLLALQQLARAWRKIWGGKVVGVTGSNGKTSVKTMLSQILSRQYRVYATPGNLNNHIGLPLCVLNIQPEHQVAVLEMGASACGEIAELAAIAQPDVGLVTQAGAAHLAGFGGAEAVARGKGELFAALGGNGIAILNQDDVYASLWRELAGPAQVVSFGRDVAADVRADKETNAALRQTFTLCVEAQQQAMDLPLPGRHSVMNALAATAAALQLNVPVGEIAEALRGMQAVDGRLQVQALAGGAQLIDDSYNANPGSLAAAVAVLASCPSPRHFVLGDMAELGDNAEQFHHEAGLRIAEAGIEHLWTCGRLSAAAAKAFGPAAQHFGDRDELSRCLAAALGAKDTILIKGSRSAGMDQVVRHLMGNTAA